MQAWLNRPTTPLEKVPELGESIIEKLERPASPPWKRLPI